MKEKLSYKEAMAEIEQVVASLEENKLDVDELGVKVKRVSELLAFCKAIGSILHTEAGCKDLSPSYSTIVRPSFIDFTEIPTTACFNSGLCNNCCKETFGRIFLIITVLLISHSIIGIMRII